MHTQRQSSRTRGVWRALGWVLVVGLVVVVVGGWGVWRMYQQGLEPVSNRAQSTSVTIAKGASVETIATQLKNAGLIRSTRSFTTYVRLHKASPYLQAGTYEISPSQPVADIVTQLTHGKVATTLVTILPGQRLDQIRQSLVNQGFSEAAVDAALEPGQYESNPLLASKPRGANLEGFLYPDSFQRTTETTPQTIVEQALFQMHKRLTPEILAGFRQQNLSVYQGLTLASIVEKEVVVQTERTQAAQVFLKRLRVGMPLGSDVTAHYGSVLAGRGKDVTYDTPFNTRLHTGLPPTPISNVSASSLTAVAKPAQTDWLFFVTGDNGTTYFSKTVQEHEALAAKYCHELCKQ